MKHTTKAWSVWVVLLLSLFLCNIVFSPSISYQFMATYGFGVSLLILKKYYQLYISFSSLQFLFSSKFYNRKILYKYDRLPYQFLIPYVYVVNSLYMYVIHTYFLFRRCKLYFKVNFIIERSCQNIMHSDFSDLNWNWFLADIKRKLLVLKWSIDFWLQNHLICFLISCLFYLVLKFRTWFVIAVL